jgi:hypothetical protein
VISINIAPKIERQTTANISGEQRGAASNELMRKGE